MSHTLLTNAYTVCLDRCACWQGLAKGVLLFEPPLRSSYVAILVGHGRTDCPKTMCTCLFCSYTAACRAPSVTSIMITASSMSQKVSLSSQVSRLPLTIATIICAEARILKTFVKIGGATKIPSSSVMHIIGYYFWVLIHCLY